jgi:hypothetical protein
MRLSLASFLLGIGALLAIYVGIWVAVNVAMLVERAFGAPWGTVTLGTAIAVCAGVALAMWTWQDRLMDVFGPLLGRMGVEQLYCQTCGETARHDAVACVKCGDVRFGILPPRTRSQLPFHVQIGVDVVCADSVTIGVVKQRRVGDFLVARPHHRDLYVPYTAITGNKTTGAQTTAVTLGVLAAHLDAQGWPHPALVGRTRT